MRKLVIFLLFFMSWVVRAQINFTLTTTPTNGSLTCVTKSVKVAATAGPVSAITYTFYGPGSINQVTTSLNCQVAGVYTVNCQSGTLTGTQTFVINSDTVIPQVAVAPNFASLTCSAPLVYLTASTNVGNASYMWQGPGVGLPITTAVYTAATAGTYTVNVQNTVNGCVGSTIATVMEAREYPVMQLASIYTLECSGSELQLALPAANPIQYSVTATSGVTYTLGANLLKLDQPGNYTLAVTNTLSGCSSQYVFSVWNCVGLETLNDVRISFQPNPTSGLIRFTSPVNGPVTVSTADGKSWIAIADDENGLDLSDLPEGIYFIEFQYNHQKHRRRVVLVR